MTQNGILTNKFKAEYNYEMIDRDFDIYMVTKDSQKLDSTNILDIPTANFKALSVQYSFGLNAFVLFKKDAVNEFEFRQELQDTFQDVTVQKVDILDEESRKEKFFYNDRLLAQLLLNSIRVPKSENFSYHNLTGKLFYFNPTDRKKDKESKKILIFHGLEVSLTPGMYLKLKVKTFRLKNAREKGREYIFDAKTGNFRKKLSSDEDSDTYIEGSYKDKHNTVDFLDFGDIHKFRSCKLGVMQRFLADVVTYLGNYLTLTPEHIKDAMLFKIPAEQKKPMNSKHLAMLIDRPIQIVDEVKTELSAQIVDSIIDQLKKYYDINAEIGKLSKYAYNIRLIHDKKHYEGNDLNDIHDSLPDNITVQHITIENALNAKLNNDSSSKSAHPMINKTLQELIIKNDVQQRKISIFNWSNLAYDKTWTFVTRKKLKTEYSESKKPHINRVGASTYDNYRYTALSIKPDGSMNFDEFCDNDEDLTVLMEKTIEFFERTYKAEHASQNDVEGLVYSSYDSFHAIIRTNMTTMPDINAIFNGLEETNPKSLLSKEQLCDAISEFILIYPEYGEFGVQLQNNLCDFQGKLTKSAFKSLINYRKNPKTAPCLNRFLHINYGIRVFSEIKAMDMNEEYLIDNMLDIKYYYDTNDKSQIEFNYFVGTRRSALKTSVHNACTVRKVIAENGNIAFEEMLSLMAVDFVRNKQHTVLPFPFKYLREYTAMREH